MSLCCCQCVCVVEGNKAAVELLTLLLLLVHMILLQLLDEFGKLILCGQWTGIVGATGTGSARAAAHLVGIAWTTRATSTGPNADRRLVRVHVVVHFTTGTGRRWRMGRQMVR